MEDIKSLLSRMTLEEKASLCSGQGFWHTQAIERLGIPAGMVSDGPHGLRKQDLSDDVIDKSIPAVCFPAGCATAASFDRDLVRQMGETLGNECQAEDLTLLLGPAVNIKRSPLCGRNFEYYSEDPCLAGQIASAFIGGVQSRRVGTCIKHFLANNQEYRRLSVSAQIDERALREIYLAAFETPIREQKPWAVMCAYNKINGTYAAENKTFLTDVLRDEWGFDGMVVSDWGAVNKRVEDLAAGLDLEMPYSGGVTDAQIVAAVREGRLEESVLDTAAERVLTAVYRHLENKDPNAVFDREADHQVSRQVAEGSMVLLKNDGGLLPLDENSPIAFIGQYAEKPRFQGGGSSHVNCFKVSTALDAAKDLPHLCYAKGFDDCTDETDSDLLDEAVETAKHAQAAVVFVGLPDSWESEGFDRKTMGMPQNQIDLIEAVAAVQPNTVVVLHNGAPIEMPWADRVSAILETYLSGQAVGEVTVDILTGRVNPSGKLPESFPYKLSDNPTYLDFPGNGEVSEYRESIFVGYRYYDRKEMPVRFAFGHGLSYTSFAYSNLQLEKTSFGPDDTVTVSLDVTNTGRRTGKEAVQLYVRAKNSRVARPLQELRDFAKVELRPGECKTVTFQLSRRAFTYWEPRIHDWYLENGEYEVRIGSSSRDIRLVGTLTAEGSPVLPLVCTADTVLEELMEHPKAMELLQPMIKAVLPDLSDEPEDSVARQAISNEMRMASFLCQPVHSFLPLCSRFGYDSIDALVEKLNEALN